MIETVLKKNRFESVVTDRRPVPQEDYWYENVWNDYLKGKVFE